MREVLAARDAGDRDAGWPSASYLHRLRAGIAAMAAAMGGIDALVFTGGVGENSPEVRSGGGRPRVPRLGIDRAHAADASPATARSAPGARVRSFVVAAREDLQIAAEVRAVLACPAAPDAAPPPTPRSPAIVTGGAAGNR